MRNAARHYRLLFVILLAVCPAWTQNMPQPAPDLRGTIDFTQKAVVRALDFNQGDIKSLRDALDDFTPDGWSAFVKSLEGFLDDKGAPKYTSDFAPSGNAVVVRQENGVVHLTIPGKLTQTQNQSRTVYGHTEIDVQVSGKPPKIQHLKTIYRAKIEVH